MSNSTDPIDIGGPWYEDLAVGDTFSSAPAVTLTSGLAAMHQSILGDRLRLALDSTLCKAVGRGDAPFAHPGLVCDVVIGQSTLVTQRVVANLFYRGLVFRRLPRIGDTLRTVTRVVALKDTSPRPGRPSTGLAALRITAVDQQDRAVLDFHRCAMLPARSAHSMPGHTGDLDVISSQLDQGDLIAAVTELDLARFGALVPGSHGGSVSEGTVFSMASGETVTGATELVRLTLNLAAVHSDPRASVYGRRLVYGGHTIGIAAGHLIRALPNLVTIAGWRSCDHLAPVFEGDVLVSEVRVHSITRIADAAGVLLDLQVLTSAVRDDVHQPVLDWQLVGVMAQ